ncbi:MAG: hypothetical protein KTR31_02390 [Myxococcales bacterium]|nr:hypothetical protein [Myxococcales bacterium]
MRRVAWTLLAAGCGQAPALPFELLLEYVLIPSALTEDLVVVHEVGTLLPGTRVYDVLSSPVALEVTEPSTLFLVDQQADALWRHPVEWVWVDDDGDIHVEPRDSFPAVDGSVFLPALHRPVYGSLANEPTTQFTEPVWEGRRQADDEECALPRPRVALGVAGTRMAFPEVADVGVQLAPHMDRAASIWALPAPGGRTGDETTTTPSTSSTEHDMSEDLDVALRQLVGGQQLDELVLFVLAHGTDDGRILLGDHHPQELTVEDLVEMLAQVRTERLVVVLGSCHSGAFAERLPAALKDAGMTRTEITVIAAAAPNELAYVGAEQPASAFGLTLLDFLATAATDEPLPWERLDPPTLSTVTRTGLRTQNPVRGEQERCVPKIALHRQPDSERTRCHAAWLDNLQGSADDSAIAYDRQMRLTGSFGVEAGFVELQQEDGDWVTVPTTLWTRDAIVFQMPMRRDGFPSSGFSPEAAASLPPTKSGAYPGKYAVRVVSATGETSDSEPLFVAPQVYTAQITPHPTTEWLELWNRRTPASLYTNGSTIQLSRTWSAIAHDPTPPGASPLLDHDEDQPHETAPDLLGTPGWAYEIGPTWHSPLIAKASAPSDRAFWGFRIRFEPEPNDAQLRPWFYTLIYD